MEKCARCKRTFSEEHFSKTRDGQTRKCCDTCLKRYRCVDCNFKTGRKIQFKDHLKIHQKEFVEIKNHKCDLCDSSFLTKVNLQMHIKSIHLKIKDIKCPLCSYLCSSKSTILTHLSQIHYKIRNFKCQDCNSYFALKNTLLDHQTICNGIEKGSDGEICTKRLFDKMKIEYVFRSSHHKIKKYTTQNVVFDFIVKNQTYENPIFIEYSDTNNIKDILKSDFTKGRGFPLLRLKEFDKSVIVDFLEKHIIP